MRLLHERNTGATIVRFLLGVPPFDNEPIPGAIDPLEAEPPVWLYFDGAPITREAARLLRRYAEMTTRKIERNLR